MNKGVDILVFLSIGVVYGFILPLGGLELDLVSEASNDNAEKKESLIKMTTPEPEHTKELPNNRSDIDENALYEHAAAKQNNQSERAFIYINQKYKKPSLHQYFRLAQNGPEFSRSFHLPPPLPQAFIQRRNEPCKSEPEHVNYYSHGYDIPYRSPDIPSYFLPPPLVYDCNFKDSQNILSLRGVAYSSQNNYDRQDNIRRDFIELLKSPLLRPSNKININTKYDDMSGSRLSSPNHKNYPYHSPIRNEHNSEENILVDERKKDMQKNFGFGSYGLRPAFQSRGMIQRVEEPSFEEELIINDEPSRFHEKSQYEDRLLDQYLRDALGEQVTSKEKEIVTNDCSYRDCVLQSAKTSSSITSQKDTKKHECKCGQHLKSKENVFFLSKTRSERMEKQFNKTNNTLHISPPDNAYFKEMISQNLNSKQLNDGFALNSIIKLNSTMYN